MQTPEFSSDGHPTDATLDKISKWQAVESGFLEFCKEAMDLHYGKWNTRDEFGCLLHSVSTGGWSSNEEIIGAMHRNYVKWAMHWIMSRRGGYYEFEEHI